MRQHQLGSQDVHGIEFQVFLPVINAPFRVYWAYNPLRLDTITRGPVPITRDMFPPGAAGDLHSTRSPRMLCAPVSVARTAQDVPLHRGDDILNSASGRRTWTRLRTGFATTTEA